MSKFIEYCKAYSSKEIEDMGYKIQNNIIESVDVNCIAHFGNVVSFEIFCSNVVPYSAMENTKNIGYVIRTFIELFDLEKDDGIRLSDIKNVPCRIVLDGDRAIGVGHFMKDKFVLTSDLAKSGKEKQL